MAKGGQSRSSVLSKGVYFLLEVALQHALQSNAVAYYFTRNTNILTPYPNAGLALVLAIRQPWASQVLIIRSASESDVLAKL